MNGAPPHKPLLIERPPEAPQSHEAHLCSDDDAGYAHGVIASRGGGPAPGLCSVWQDEHAAEWFEYMFSLSTNWNYLMPEAGPLKDERVYFLQRPPSIVSQPGIQTYFVPDNVYVFFPIIVYEWDDVDTLSPLTVEELRDTVRNYVNGFTSVRASIDGVPLTNPLAYRTESPVFSVFLPTSDNVES